MKPTIQYWDEKQGRTLVREATAEEIRQMAKAAGMTETQFIALFAAARGM